MDRLPLPDLGDGVVHLRELQTGDVTELVRWCQSDVEILRWVMRPDPFTERDATAWVLERLARRSQGEQLTLAIVERDSDRLAGAIWLGRFDWIARRGELADWVDAGFRGRRLGARAVTLMSAWALEEIGLVRFQILAPVQNPASQGVALRAGFTREGVLRSYRSILGEHVDLVAFSRLRGDPQPAPF